MTDSTVQRRPRLLRGAAAFAIIAFGLALYAPASKLLLFWDDIPHLFWLDTKEGLSYWLDSTGFPFYRPAAFAVWSTLRSVFGRYNGQALHILPIGLHVANALLVAGLASKLGGKDRTGLWAGLIFVSFPFSYQAVIPAAALFHPMLVFGLLGATWLLLDALTAHRNVWWRLTLAWMLAFWAIFGHENGVLAPLLIGGVLTIAQLRESMRLEFLKQRRFIVTIAPLAFISSVYAVLWTIVPNANEVTGLSNLPLFALDVKVGQTLQGFSFPLAALGRATIDPQSGTRLALLSGGLALAIYSLWLWRRWHTEQHASSTFWLGVLGIAWLPVVMLPAWLFLDINYLLGSPRLAYLATVGIAWAWAALFTDPLPGISSDRLRLSVGIAGTGLFVVLGAVFVRARVTEQLALDTIYRDVGDVVSRPLATDARARMLVVNGPAVLGPSEQTFLLGGEGSVFLTDTVALHDVLLLNGFIPHDAPRIIARNATDVVPQVNQMYGVAGSPLDRAALRDFGSVAMVNEIDGELRTVLVGEQLPASRNPNVDLAGDFGNGIMLEEGRMERYTLPNVEGDVLRLTLTWQVGATPEQPIEVFVHLLCGETLLTQADGPPLGRLYPFNSWQRSERWREYRYFIAPSIADTACLRASVGLFDSASGQRLSVVTDAGSNADSIKFALVD